MALTTTNFEFALKELYPPGILRDMTFANNPLLGLLPKNENARGELVKCPVIYGPPAGRSASFTTAQTNKGNTAGKAFLLTRKSDYAIGEVTREAVQASKGDEAAFVEALQTETDQTVRNAVRSLAKAIYRDGLGQLAQIASVTVANPMVITLLDINDISNFEAAMVLEADDTAAGTSLRASPATATIAALNRDTGTITTGFDNSGGATDWAANDYLFQDGDESAMISGLAAWIPASAPGATAFFGVDRTADVVRLGGNRVTGTGMAVETALHKGTAKASREGAIPSHAFLNDVQYHEMMTSLGAKADFVEQGAVDANVYFSGAKIWGSRGPVKVFPDFNCPSQKAYVLQLDTWTLYSIGPAPHIFNLEEDLEFIPVYNADAYEIRVGYYAQLGCTCPGYNALVTLDAATF